MKTEVIKSMVQLFELYSIQMDDGERWTARSLQKLLGYATWQSFANVIEKAKAACGGAKQDVKYHFIDTTTMIPTAKSAKVEVTDILLTRYACYLIAQNGDPSKQEIAFAQTYFAVRTRQAELIEKRLLEMERIDARGKLRETESELSKVIYEHTDGKGDFAKIRSKGDRALFGRTTREMKAHWKVPLKKPLADFAPTVVLKAKDFAATITVHNTREGALNTENAITEEHVTNNEAVRTALIDRGIRPENLPPEEDAAKVERRLAADERKALKGPDTSISN